MPRARGGETAGRGRGGRRAQAEAAQLVLVETEPRPRAKKPRAGAIAETAAVPAPKTTKATQKPTQATPKPTQATRTRAPRAAKAERAPKAAPPKAAPQPVPEPAPEPPAPKPKRAAKADTPEPRRRTAQELASGQREISVSEFFTKNRHLLGFDSPAKALLTTVKEAVDNSFDACEEAGILPEITISIYEISDTRYRVVVEDNGPGIVRQQIPKVFGQLLYGSKFHRLRQSLIAEEPVLIERDGRVERIPIGRLADGVLGEGEEEREVSALGWRVPAFDRATWKYAWRPVSHVIRHRRENEILQVRTECGKSVRVTGCHSLFTFDPAARAVTSVEARALRPGSKIIAPRRPGELMSTSVASGLFGVEEGGGRRTAIATAGAAPVAGAAAALLEAAPSFAESDLCLLRVRDVRPVTGEHPFVYDLSVPGCENFVAGEGYPRLPQLPRTARHRDLRRRHVRPAHDREADRHHLAHRRQSSGPPLRDPDRHAEEPAGRHPRRGGRLGARARHARRARDRGHLQEGAALGRRLPRDDRARQPARDDHLPLAEGRGAALRARDRCPAARAEGDQAASLRGRARFPDEHAQGHQGAERACLPDRGVLAGVGGGRRRDPARRRASPRRPRPGACIATRPRRSTRR